MAYFIANDGIQKGPLEKHQLAASGLRPDTLVWTEGMTDWLPAHQVQDLRDMFSGPRAAAPPPPPPPPTSAGPRYYAPPQGYAAPYAPANSNRIAAGICAILLGGLGVHKFILGMTTAGVVMLLISIASCGIGYPIMHIIGIIEGIIYLTKSDEEFYQVYVVQKKSWF